MPEKELLDQKIADGVEGKISIKDGKIVLEVDLSGKTILDAIAKKVGGPVPQEIALFIEATFGLT